MSSAARQQYPRGLPLWWRVLSGVFSGVFSAEIRSMIDRGERRSGAWRGLATNTQRCSTPSRSRFSSSRARPALCFVSNIVKLPELFVSNILVFVQPLVCIVIVNVVVLYCIVLYSTLPGTVAYTLHAYSPVRYRYYEYLQVLVVLSTVR